MQLNKPLIAIVGPSGSGKSTSLRNLDPATTRIIDIERKGLPWRLTPEWEQSIIQVDDPSGLKYNMEKVLGNSAKNIAPMAGIKVLVIESFLKYCEVQMFYSRAANKNYDIFNDYNNAVGDLLDKAKNNKIIVIFTCTDEIVKIPQASGTEQGAKRIKIEGKKWEGCIEKEFLLVLYTEAKINPTTKKMEYFFVTNTDGINSAKTPMWMELPQLIPNDINEVIKKLEPQSDKKE
jgi:energy-coupling factor transporter ATP-binding protein EcfA2